MRARATFGRLAPLALVCCLIYSAIHFALPDRDAEDGAPAAGPRTAPTGPLPLAFVENQGQWDEATRFLLWRGAVAAALERDTIRVRLGGERPAAIGLRFEGASPTARLEGEGRHGTRYNFFFGADPARWRSGVGGFAAVRYEGLYPGVDVRVREGGEPLAYDLLLAPGADLGQVVVSADGAAGLRLGGDGALIIEAEGEELRQSPPVAWEVLPTGAHRPVESRFRLLDKRRYGFEVEGRDLSLPLVIDPALEWSTFIGGSGDESLAGLEIAPDGSGEIVVAGQTQSPDFPRGAGNLAPIGWTPYVARLSADGGRLVYATFFGGTFNHSVQDVALDAAGRPVVVGDTNSLDFPTTPGAFDRTPGNGMNGDYDAYVIKFDAAGAGPLFGTYLGGNPGTGNDQAWNAVFDGAGAPIVSGLTSSASFPTTAGAFDRGVAGQDLFIARLSPDGSQLTYSTFFGGDGLEEVFGMAIDPAGVLSLTGRVSQSVGQGAPMPTTPGAFDTTINGGGSPAVDAYLVRLKPDGAGAADLRYATFIGGAQFSEAGTAVAVDPSDPTSIVVAGWTRSGDFPTTPGALLRTHFAPVDTSMATVMRFSFPAGGGGSLVWSTLYGAPGNQNANAVTIDSVGRPVIAGATAANNPPTTEGAYDRIPGIGSRRGNPDAFVARLSADGSRNEYSTLLGGGERDDTALEIAHAGGGAVIVAGLTDSPDFPVTPGALDTVYGADGQLSGNSAPGTLADDLFLARLSLDAGRADTAPPPAPALKGPPSGSAYTAHAMAVTFDWTDVSDPSGIAAYHIQLSPNPDFINDITAELSGWYEAWVPGSLDVTSFDLSQTGSYHWRVQALDGANNLGPWSEVRTFSVSAPVTPAAPALVSPPNLGRYGPGSVILDWNPATGAQTYEVQVDTTSNFSNANRVWATGLTATRHTVALNTTGRRWWRVRGTNSNGATGPWSTARSFEIRSGSPPAPVPPPDQDGGTTPPPGGIANAVARISPEELPLGGGASGQLTVHLNGAAPAGGAVVSLASRYPELATVPASVTVPAGATSASFSVSAVPGLIKGGFTLVSAEYGGAAAQGILVNIFADQPSPVLYALQLNGVTVGQTTGQGTTTIAGGQTVQGSVAFTPGWVAPAGGAVVALGSTDPALVSVPAQVVIPAGANSATFSVTTQPVAAVTRVSVLAARSWTHRIVLELTPSGTLSALSLSPSTVSGGTPATGTVLLSGPAPAGGVVVALVSSDTRWATVPASVTVPAGATSASFTVTTLPNNSGQGQFAMITATAGGVERWATINVNPQTTVPGALNALTLNPTIVVGGNSVTGQVALGVPAPSGGVLVSLFSQNPGLATVPASVTIPAGALGASFTVNTSAITGINQTVRISAGTSNSSREVMLTITAPTGTPPPTATGVPPTATGVPPTATGVPPTATGVPPTATGVPPTATGVPPTATGVPPTATTAPVADTVSIDRAEYDSGKRRLRVEARGSSSSATLRVYVTATNALIGTLSNNGGGRYSGDLSWSSNPQNITVRSSLGGSASRSVTLK